MRIDPKDVIAGLPAMDARKVMSHIWASDCATARFIAGVLDIKLSNAEAVLQALETEGYLQKDGEALKATELGARLRNASASKPLRQTTCQKLVDGFVERCNVLRDDEEFIVHVKRAVLFGSHARGADRPSDVDIVVEMERKFLYLGDKIDHKIIEQHRKRADRNWRNTSEWAGWFWTQAKSFLKARKTGLSLHSWGIDGELAVSEGARLIYEHDGSLAPIPSWVNREGMDPIEINQASKFASQREFKFDESSS